ncbi:MAG: RNA-binding S4 domain-containing protein [Burkholderiaceae bacterium]|jgi:ribosome-associated heat shock protein Hsp15
MGRGKGARLDGAAAGTDTAERARCRLDKWLWAARFFKTRALAMEAIDRNRILVGGHPAKPSREVHLADEIEIREPGGLSRVVTVRGLSDVRGPAPVAQQLYAETEASRAAREATLSLRRMGVEPALTHTAGRPTKRDRRDLADWDRWSASLDDTSRT